MLAIELQRLSVASSKQQKAYLNKLRTAVQVKQNVQRTLAIELQKLSVAFRKQQKAYLNKLRKSSAASGSFSLLDDAAGPAGRAGGDEDFDPGFSEIQVRTPPQKNPGKCLSAHVKPQPLMGCSHAAIAARLLHTLLNLLPLCMPLSSIRVLAWGGGPCFEHARVNDGNPGRGAGERE